MRLNKSYPMLTVIFMLILCLLAGFACGKKKWPRPPGDEDSFAWGLVSAKLADSCLIITAGLTGNRNNLESITLQLQAMSPDDACLGCPFFPTESHDMDIDRVALANSPKDSTLRLTFCPNKPFSQDIIYQFRLLGRNAQPSIPPALSRVYLINADKDEASLQQLPSEPDPDIQDFQQSFGNKP